MRSTIGLMDVEIIVHEDEAMIGDGGDHAFDVFEVIGFSARWAEA